MLRLARPLDAGVGRLESLELSLGAVRFPLDVTEGPVRFRTRRTVVRHAWFRIDPRDLCRAAAARGVTLVIAGPSARGALACALRDEVGTVAFDATVVPDGADLLIAVDGLRSAVDGPASPWARVARAAGALGLELDADRGAWRLARPVRSLLAEALVTRGWRLPDERTAELAPPLHRDGALHLQSGPGPNDRALQSGPGPNDRALQSGPGPNDRGPVLIEEARGVAPVLARLAGGDVDGALDRLEAALRRVEERPAAEASLRATLGRLRATLLCELAGREEEALGAAGTDDDPAKLAVHLRIALRRGDGRAAEAAAERLAAVEPVSELAAEALLAASEACRAVDPKRAHRLVSRALSRRPGDTALLVRCIELAELAEDAEGVEDIARRALSSPARGEERARVASAAARALERMAPAPDTEALWREALLAAPDEPEALAGLGALYARRGDREAAIARLDRASEGFAARGDGSSAARTWQRAAELLAGGGRLAAAEQRLEQAVERDDADPALWCALARVRLRLGATAAAAMAYASLLDLGARAPATLAPALVEAASFHLDERADAEAARPFVEMLARRNPDDARVRALRGRLAEAERADADAALTDTGEPFDVDAVSSRLAALAEQDAAAFDDAVRDAVATARRAGALGALGDLAERLASRGRVPADPELLAVLERHAIEPGSRAALARAAARALRGAGRPGPAALALARAGVAARDAATLRAAIDLAEDAGTRAEALEAVSIALEVVGEGPARAALLARRARLEAP